MLAFLRRNYLSIDPRTLGLVRIAIALLLLTDLIKRSLILSLFYTNHGLIPNHRALWRPMREFVFSFLFALSEKHEVRIAFALIGVVYVCFLVGYRTRLMHILSWISLCSLQVRVDLLSNGGDFVFSDLVLWTVFLPLGRRFSVDAVRQSLRTSDRDLPALVRWSEQPRNTTPVVSLAVLAATVQLTVIYIFNAISKDGTTWKDGSAVHFLVHQERIVTTLGVIAREHLPLSVFKLLSYGTIVVEGALPLLILSPWGRPLTRRLAIALVFGLHGSIALLSNLGLFSPVMMAFSLLLIDARDWDVWQAWARARPRLQLFVEESTGLCFQAARVWARLDLHRRAELLPLTASAADGGYRVEVTGTRFSFEPALRKLLAVLPAGVFWVSVARLTRPISAPALRWIGRHRADLSRELGLLPAGVEPLSGLPETQPPPAARKLRLLRRALSELAVALLLVVATSQLLIENEAIPHALKHQQPRWIRAGVDYFRLNQGWSMFAPDAPTTDLWVVVDAVTRDGRHVDPYNQLASRVADASLRSIPKRLAQSAAYCNYTLRIPSEDNYHDPLREWILAYHRRTRRPEDRIVQFRVYVIEQESPRPGESAPRNVTAHVFLQD